MSEPKTLSERHQNAVAIQAEGEDGSLYLATVCSMMELAALAAYPLCDQQMIADAKLMQASLARHGKQIRIM